MTRPGVSKGEVTSVSKIEPGVSKREVTSVSKTKPGAPKSEVEHFPYNVAGHQTDTDDRYHKEMQEFFQRSLGTPMDKLRSWTKFVPRPEINRFLARNALFSEVLHVHGYIIECGVFLGGGLMTWGQLSAIYEPSNHVRRVVGFDSFQGFPDLHEKDAGSDPNYAVPGGLAVPALEDLRECIRLYDLARPLGHIPRVQLVPGNAVETIPRYVEENRHLVVAMLYLDFDIYEPTRVALEAFLPRMPKGAVLAFDELNQDVWPGETQAVLDVVGLRNLRIRRFPFHPHISYAILE